MKKTVVLVLCFISSLVYSQHNISGTFSPADEYSWLIAYRLTPTSQVYVADTKIKKGEFNLEIPTNALPGTYRLVYAVPQDEFYIDVLYSGKEDIILNFKSGEEVAFITSKENILFSTYFKEIADLERDVIKYYSSKSKNTKEYKKLNNSLLSVQKAYESKTNGLLVNDFIKANHPFIATSNLTPEQYIKAKKDDYFTYLDFTNTTLQGSNFLKNKVINFAFTALPLKSLSDAEIEEEIQSNINTVAQIIKNLSDDYQFTLFHSIYKNASSLELSLIPDFVLNQYLKSTVNSEENKKTLKQIEAENRLRIGAIAPEIEWQSKGKQKKLSTLESARNYILIFWSSTCSHCLHELPALHKELKKFSQIQVVAIGLEDDEISWKLESEKLNDFEHVIALGKWDSKYADLYDIHQTPTYYILDSKKRIVLKPESDKVVVDFLTH
ncbi:thioredoxin family protein [Aurantibacter sp.]|uniref:TlpA family protein disulfide reductase n=1 Tax=Aurantibacter sp. TaxID=2807103 RepID=UPI00326611EE